MEPTMAMLRAYLNEQDYSFQQVDDDTLLLQYTMENTAYTLILNLDGPLLHTLVYIPLPVPVARRGALLELINRINDRLRLGAFLFLPAKSYVGFRFALVAPDGLSAGQVDWAMMAHSAVDHYYPAFAALAWGDRTPEEALARVVDDETAVPDDADRDAGRAGEDLGSGEMPTTDADDDTAFAV